jgi:hypothetical protein
MYKKTILTFAISSLLFACQTTGDHNPHNTMPSDNVTNQKILDVSTLTTIYKKPDMDKCTYIDKIQEHDFDFKATKERVYKKALEKGATHIYIYKITTAYTNTPALDQNSDLGNTSSEVFLIKAKIYKCKEDD